MKISNEIILPIEFEVKTKLVYFVKEKIKSILNWFFSWKLKKINSLYMAHKNEECYLFGDGISIKWMDLNCFKDKIAILGNFSVYHNEAASLNAKYCSMIEPFFFYPYFPYHGNGKFELIKHYLHKGYLKYMKRNPNKLYFVNISNFFSTLFTNSLYVHKNFLPSPIEQNPFRERKDALEGTFKFQISLAIFMGFKKVYLIGHDYTHFPSKSLHFYEKGTGISNDIKMFNKEFIEYAKQYIEITTITIDAKSETLDSITYEEYTGMAPKFRENNELVIEDMLSNLATWHGYTI